MGIVVGRGGWQIVCMRILESGSPGSSRGDQDSWQAFKIARQKALKEADEEVRKKFFPEPR